VRGGLLELFYGVYNRDADRCLEALITMGVLVSRGDGRRRLCRRRCPAR
jgi:predicted unusual protein kinase regulating ubiquinone biosynthesis (AarF/ABC1/UbiB family)